MPERNDMSKPWARERWAVQAADGATIEIETDSALTWAVRALAAAGGDGFRPVAAKHERWTAMVGRLRDLGVPVVDLPTDRDGLSGFRLASPIRRLT